MRTFCAALLLGMAGMGCAQQTTGCFTGADGQCAHSQPKPLKCGKLEHLEPAKTTLTTPSGIEMPTATYQHCAPDMHSLTEKEWQELMQRIKDLEYVAGKTFKPYPHRTQNGDK